MRPVRDRARACLVAFRFLTRLPLPAATAASPIESSPELLGWSALCYPLVGLSLGAGLWLLWLGTGSLPGQVPTLASGALMLAFWVWSTGGLHLDGLADCADAWVGGIGSRERTLRILKDPLTGSMGVVALVLILLVKFAALASLPSGAAGGLILLLTPALARAQLLALALTTPSARPDGLGAALQQSLPHLDASLLLVLGVLLMLVFLALAGHWALGILLVATAGALLFVWRHSMMQRLGGFTGDTAGALVELTEASVLLVAVLLIAD